MRREVRDRVKDERLPGQAGLPGDRRQAGGGGRAGGDAGDQARAGPQARFGRGVMENVGNRVLAEFAARLEQEVAPASDGRPPTSADPGPERLPPVDEAFDMGAALVQTSAARTARVVAPIVVAAMALLVFWRRRR